MDTELLRSLHSALKTKDISRVEAALQAGADPNGYALNEHNPMSPPMTFAAATNFVAGLELVHRYGGLINGSPISQWLSPLAAACVKGCSEAINWLAQHGADPLKKGAAGRSAMQDALALDSLAGARALLNAFPVLRGQHLQQAAHRAIRSGDIGPQTTAWLLANGVPPDLADDGESWLAMLQSRGGEHAESIELLLTAGANVNLMPEGGKTALHKAVDAGSLDGFLRLLKAGADPDLPGIANTTVREILIGLPEKSEMFAALTAWEASQMAHQAIQGASADAGVRPL